MHFNLYFIYVISTACVASLHDEDNDDIYTIKYTADNFKEVSQKNHFIMFYRPWCDHCQKFAPIWKQLAEEFNTYPDLIKIGKVDCTTEADLCSQNNVTHYPTLTFFKTGVSEVERYQDLQDLESLVKFVNEQLEKIKESAAAKNEDKNITEELEEDEYKNKFPEEVSEGLFELTQYNFLEHVASGTHFVKFYSPYCSYCWAIEQTWIDLAKILKHEDIGIEQFNCKKYGKFCTRNGIKGYPTLLWFVDGELLHENVNDESYDELKEYVNKMRNLTKKQILKIVEEENAASIAAYEERKKAYEEAEAAKRAAVKEEAETDQGKAGSGQEDGELSEENVEVIEEEKTKLQHSEL